MKHLVNTSKDKTYAVVSANQCHGENANFSLNGSGYQIIKLRTASALIHAISIQMDLARETPTADLFNIMHLSKTEITDLERRCHGEVLVA